jgi:hypothetical protein
MATERRYARVGMANNKDRRSFRYQAKYKPMKSRILGEDPLIAELKKQILEKDNARKVTK